MPSFCVLHSRVETQTLSRFSKKKLFTLRSVHGPCAVVSTGTCGRTDRGKGAGSEGGVTRSFGVPSQPLSLGATPSKGTQRAVVCGSCPWAIIRSGCGCVALYCVPQLPQIWRDRRGPWCWRSPPLCRRPCHGAAALLEGRCPCPLGLKCLSRAWEERCGRPVGRCRG